MYYTVYRSEVTPGFWYFKIDAYITDGWNDDDCIYVDFAPASTSTGLTHFPGQKRAQRQEIPRPIVASSGIG